MESDRLTGGPVTCVKKERTDGVPSADSSCAYILARIFSPKVQRRKIAYTLRSPQALRQIQSLSFASARVTCRPSV